MRAMAAAFGLVALLAGALALSSLLAPVPARTDLAGFSMLAIAVWSAYACIALGTRASWWRWGFPAAWLGLGIATLVLAYKDTFPEELAHFGAPTLAWHMLLHVAIAPMQVFFGFAVGFADPQGWLYVLASVAAALLGAELLRRRLWPRARGEPASEATTSGP
jgi:hypothetical protein